jgi:iron complex outermembrane receptor protein
MTYLRNLALLLLVTSQASAESGTALDPIVVTGSRIERSSFDLPYAVSTVDAETLQSAGPQVSLSEALARVPGIVANNRSNYAQDVQLSSRGYGARASFGVRGLRLYTDGIPATAPDGQGQVSSFNLSSAERVEVLRGPFSALYGNGSGGVIALISRSPQQDAVSAGFDFGSFGMRQYRLGAETRLDQRWSALAEFSSVEIDGFRPHSSAERRLGFARLAYEGDQDRLILTASNLDQPADDPLGLTRAQLDENPKQTTSQATQFNTRKNTGQSQAGLSWRHKLGGEVFRELAISSYFGQRAVTQWQAIPVAVQDNPNHPGGVIDFDRDFYGSDARLQMHLGEVSLITGVSLDLQDEDRRGYRNSTGGESGPVLGATGELRRDETNRVRGLDQYAQAEWRFAKAWNGTLGLRHGEVRFKSRDHYLANGDDSDQLDFSYTNPVLGVVFAASEHLNYYLSAAAGFESPTSNELAYRPDGSPGFNTSLDPQTSRQFELGAKFETGKARLDAAIFLANTADEIVVQTNAGGRQSFGNAGRTRRYGAELSAAWLFAQRWRGLLALSWLDATYRDAFLTCAAAPCTTPTREIPADNRLPGVPEYTAFAELSRELGSGITLAVEARAVSDVAVNDINDDSAEGYAVLGLRLEHRKTWDNWSLRSLARLDNSLDREYAGSVIVNEANGRYFEPGPPRAWLLGLSLTRRF